MLKKTVIRYSLGLFFLSSLHDMGDIFYFFEDNSTHTESGASSLPPQHVHNTSDNHSKSKARCFLCI